MFHTDVDFSKRVLTMSFSQHVDSEEMKSCLEKTRSLLVDIEPGFRLLTDLTTLDSMDTECSASLGEMMSLCNESGVSAVVRVVPDRTKDIGFTLLEPFHYGKHVRISTHETLADAIQDLAA